MNEHFTQLLEQYLAGTLPEDELARLADMLASPESQWQLASLIDAGFLKGESAPGLPEPNSEAIFQRIQTSLQKPKVIPIADRRGFRWAAAAAIILFAAGAYLFSNQHVNQDHGPKLVQTNDVPAPSTARASITLSGGKLILLDTLHTSVAEPDARVAIEKTADGSVVYNGDAEGENSLLYNTLTNPRGSKVVSITLTDGTKVWLNTGSSLKYPATFAKTERRVEITGEAYFDVKHDPSRPFIVSRGQTEVTVLGTGFNVNAYDDEGAIKITLVTGSIRAATQNNGQTALLKPGEQARVTGSHMEIEPHADLDQVTAWKEGWFEFDNLDLPSILRQVARWYDIDIQYKTKPTTETFGGRISRNLPLSNVLQSLAGSKATFTLQGRTLIVE